MYTDREAVKSLLNTPHPSGNLKLAHWGLTIQELGLEIHYRPGRSNQAANALSHQPVPIVLLEDPAQAKDGEEPTNQLTTSENQEIESLALRHDSDVELKMIKQYLPYNKLPDQKEKAMDDYGSEIATQMSAACKC